MILTEHNVLFFLPLPRVPQGLPGFVNIPFTRPHDAPVPTGAYILTRINTECRLMSEKTHTLAFVPCTVRLTGVLDHNEPVLFGDLHNGIHVAGMPVKMHRHDRFSARCDRRLNPRHIYRVR